MPVCLRFQDPESEIAARQLAPCSGRIGWRLSARRRSRFHSCRECRNAYARQLPGKLCRARVCSFENCLCKLRLKSRRQSAAHLANHLRRPGNHILHKELHDLANAWPSITAPFPSEGAANCRKRLGGLLRSLITEKLPEFPVCASFWTVRGLVSVGCRKPLFHGIRSIMSMHWPIIAIPGSPGRRYFVHVYIELPIIDMLKANANRKHIYAGNETNCRKGSTAEEG